MQELSHRQAKFVAEYLIDFNGAGAAKRAGYSERAAKEVASRLLTYANVADAVEQGAQEASARLRVKREAVIDGLMEAVDAAQSATELVLVWREIAKLLDLYPSKRLRVEAKVTTDQEPTELQLQRMPATQLLKIASGDRSLGPQNKRNDS